MMATTGATEFITKPKFGKKANLIIIGAGIAGKLMADYIKKNLRAYYSTVAFVDTRAGKERNRYLNIPILGPISKIGEIVKRKKADEILIAIPSASGELIRSIVEKCEETKIDFKILPSNFEVKKSLKSGLAYFSMPRQVEIEDFFRRKPVIVNLQDIINHISRKSILVTGAAGSIGSELCTQLLEFNPLKLIVLDHGETPLHELQLELEEKHPNSEIVAELASIRDRELLEKIISKHKPEIIFHAAAYKHVPMMEKYPEEAIKNNVFGTKNLIDLADRHGISEFVLISTDKAVNPSSIMGASKKITELIAQAKSRQSNTRFTAVRFGNVIGSAGSVIPLFEKQIKKGGPVSVTHPKMTRFFMTTQEAVQLIIQSTVLGREKFNLFVLDMGKQYNILDIARDLIRLRGYLPDEDIKIKFTGARPGEKLEEGLVSSRENLQKTENERIFLISPENIDADHVESIVRKLKDMLQQDDRKAIKNNIWEIMEDLKS